MFCCPQCSMLSTRLSKSLSSACSRPEQYRWKHWTRLAAQHCLILFSTTRNFLLCTQQKTHNLFWPDENRIEQCCAAHIVQGCQQHWTSWWAWISLQSGVTMLNNIVDNLEQCGQQNIVQCCFHQARTGCAFFAVYTDRVFVVSSNYSTLFMLVYLSQHFWNEHLKISKIFGCKRWSQNLVKYGKYSLAKFVSHVFVLQAEKVTVSTAKMVTFPRVIRTHLIQISQGYIFRIL